MAKVNTVLIDTHIFLWFLDNDPRLPEKITTILTDPTVTVYLSTVSIWEIIIKKSIGKLQIPTNLKDAINASGFTILSVNLDHTLELDKLPMLHKDPFDRMLVCQSIVEKCPIVTNDQKIQEYTNSTIQ